jgi:hypothetical protein
LRGLAIIPKIRLRGQAPQFGKLVGKLGNIQLYGGVTNLTLQFLGSLQ